MNVVIYARFSSHNQTEQSIEGQLKVCHEYAAAHNYTVVGEYINRAQSGTSTDNRQRFLKMIADSEKHCSTKRSLNEHFFFSVGLLWKFCSDVLYKNTVLGFKTVFLFSFARYV